MITGPPHNQANTRYRDLALEPFKNANTYINVIDISGEILFTNKIFDCLPQRYNIGDNAFKIIKGTIEEKLRNCLASITDTKNSEELITQTPTQNGVVNWFKHSINPTIVDDKVVQFWIFSYRIESPPLAIEEEMDDVNENLQEFIGILSHDLKNPLSNIKQLIQIINRHKDNPSIFNEAISKMDIAADRMFMLIHRTLEFQKFGSSSELEEINLRNEVQKIIQENELASAHLDHISNNLPSKICAYKTEILSMVENLISYTEKEHFWVMYVKDNGIGIPAKQKANIFKPFYRLQMIEVEGNGLGLASCRRSANLHGGHIWVESEPDQGSTFYFSISKNL